MDQKTAVGQLSSLPKVARRFSTIPTKIPVRTFVAIDKLIQKATQKVYRIQKAKNSADDYEEELEESQE